MKHAPLHTALCVIACLQGTAFAQIVNNWTADENTQWMNHANWELGIPTSDHSVTIPGSNQAPYDGGDIEIDGAAEAERIVANAGTYAINIRTGGSLTLYLGGNSIFTTGAGSRTIHVDPGGTLTDSTGGANFIRATLNLRESATCTGFNDFRTGASVVLKGGAWTPGRLSEAGSIQLNSSHVHLQSGTLRLGLLGDQSVRYFDIINVNAPETSTLDLSGGSIVLVPQGDYVPKPGHSYTLWVETVPALLITSGDGRNVSIEGYPGIALDTSRWACSGTLTVMETATTILLR